jgi:hypothetical protein
VGCVLLHGDVFLPSNIGRYSVQEDELEQQHAFALLCSCQTGQQLHLPLWLHALQYIGSAGITDGMTHSLHLGNVLSVSRAASGRSDGWSSIQVLLLADCLR